MAKSNNIKVLEVDNSIIVRKDGRITPITIDLSNHLSIQKALMKITEHGIAGKIHPDDKKYCFNKINSLYRQYNERQKSKPDNSLELFNVEEKEAKSKQDQND